MCSLEGENMVLGMEWLENVGDIKANFKNLTITVKKNGAKHVLKGDPSLSKGEVTAKGMLTELRDTAAAFVVDCREL